MKNLARISAILVACLAIVSCGKSYKDIKVTSAELVSVVPSGFRMLDIVVKVGIDNPIIAFRANDVKADIKMDGVPFLALSSDGLTVLGHREESYELAFTGAMDDNFNLLSLASVVRSRDLSKFSVDMKVLVALKKGPGKVLEFKDVPLTSLIK